MFAISSFFFFNDTATTEIYTLSLHDALPISSAPRPRRCAPRGLRPEACPTPSPPDRDRKSTRLNSSHGYISYAVFCLKKKKTPNAQRESPAVTYSTHADRVPRRHETRQRPTA